MGRLTQDGYNMGFCSTCGYGRIDVQKGCIAYTDLKNPLCNSLYCSSLYSDNEIAVDKLKKTQYQFHYINITGLVIRNHLRYAKYVKEQKYLDQLMLAL
jgi:hypothetical protein